MNVFQLVKTVLDELYVQIPLPDEASKDAAIRAKMQFLSQKYLNLGNSGGAGGAPQDMDYSDPVTRFAYICKYVTCHADFVRQLVSFSQDLSSLFGTQWVNVTCIGGGPGSDFLGILKFIQQSGRKTPVKCILYDREQAWGESWLDVDQKLASTLPMTTVYQPFDVTNGATWKGSFKYLQSDLFTMIYFVSELFRVRQMAEPFFHNLFKNARSGSLFLYLDNDSAQFSDWFDTLLAQGGMRVIESRSDHMQTESAEEKTDLAQYYAKFMDVKLGAQVACRICRKL